MISSNSAKQTFGRVLEMAQREPVLIAKHNHPTAVLVSIAEYDRLKMKESVAAERAEAPAVAVVPAAKSLPVIRRKPGAEQAALSPEAMVVLVKSADLELDA